MDEEHGDRARSTQAGIDRTLITGFDEFSSVHETFIPNELVAGLAERHPDRFIPFAGADVLDGHGRGARASSTSCATAASAASACGRS